MKRLEYNPLSGEFQFVNSETVMVDKTDMKTSLQIGFVPGKEYDASALLEYQCSIHNETFIDDIENANMGGYLMICVPCPYGLDHITSNGMLVPTELSETENSRNVYFSVLPINGGKMENISIKINQIIN